MMFIELSKKLSTVARAQAELQIRAEHVLANTPYYQNLLARFGWSPSEVTQILAAVT